MSRKDQDYDEPDDWKPFKRSDSGGCLVLFVSGVGVYFGLLCLWQALGGVMQ